MDILRKLIDEDAIAFIYANKKNHDVQFNSFLNMNNIVNINGQEYLYGVDLSEDKDTTVYTPL